MRRAKVFDLEFEFDPGDPAGYRSGVAQLSRALGADERLALFGVPLFWSQSLLIGFFNYVAALPLLLWALAVAVREAEAPRPARTALLAAASVALFYMHLSAFLLFAPAAALAQLGRMDEAACVVDELRAQQPDFGLRRVAPVPQRGAAGRRWPRRRVRASGAGTRSRGQARAGTRYHGRSFGGGVIGNTTGSGPVVGGSSPPPRARKKRSRPRRLVA